MGIDDATLGTRLQTARRALGLTQGEVGSKMNMATSTVSAVEAGKRSVTGPELQEFARIYHRPVASFFDEEAEESPGFQYLFRNAEVEILDRVSLEEFRQLARDYRLIEEVAEVAPLPLPPDYSQFGFHTDHDAETLAEMERGRLGLGDAPLANLANLLDSAVGIRTFLVPVGNQSWSGLVVKDRDGRPCIGINSKEVAYRRNFNLAHEYAHVLVHLYKQGMPAARIDKAIEVVSTSANEQFANAFASAFLMPRRAVLAQLERVLGANAGKFTCYDLVHLAMQFGVSGQALSLRLVSLRKLKREVPGDLWRSGTFKDLAHALGYEVEDDVWRQPAVLPSRFRYLAMKAYEEARISLSKLAELLRINYHELDSILRSAAQAEADAELAG